MLGASVYVYACSRRCVRDGVQSVIKLGRGFIDREKERDREILRGGNKEVYKVRGLFEGR